MYICPECNQEHKQLSGGHDWYYEIKQLVCKNCKKVLKARANKWKSN